MQNLAVSVDLIRLPAGACGRSEIRLEWTGLGAAGARRLIDNDAGGGTRANRSIFRFR